MASSKRSEKGISEVHPFIVGLGMEATLYGPGWDQQRRDAWIELVIVTFGLELLVKSFGEEAVLEGVGFENLIDRFGFAKVVEVLGFEKFVESLTDEERDCLRELLANG